jgi:hypothetical protein
MPDQPGNESEQNPHVREENEVRKGARIKPGGPGMENAESEGLDSGNDTGSAATRPEDTTGIEEKGSIKNSK